MEFLLNRYRNLTALVVVIIAQLLLLAYQVKTNQDVRLIRVWSVTAVTPLAKVLEVVRRNTIGRVEDYFVLINVRTENERMKDELGRIKIENQFLKAELRTAERAQAIQAFQSRTPSKTIAARIIGNGTGANAKVVFVDRGTTSGVMRGMAVVTPDGIVGKVLGAYPTASQILLITDLTFAAGVISDKNRVHGTLKGLGQSKCLVDYVANEEKVEVGEKFYTSGDDRVFPKGWPVGTVSVVRQGSKNFKEIYVVPSGFQGGLEEVLIVLEGVHQQIPDVPAPAQTEYHVMPPPPADPAAKDKSPVLNTDADKLREKYKQIGDAQGHKFGEGLPGSKPPDFNLDPAKTAAAKSQSAAAPRTPPAKPQQNLPASSALAASPAAQTVKPPVSQPAATSAATSRPASAPPQPPPQKPSPVTALQTPALRPPGTATAGPAGIRSQQPAPVKPRTAEPKEPVSQEPADR